MRSLEHVIVLIRKKHENRMSIIEKREVILFTTIVIGLSSLICFISYKLDNSNLSILTVFTPSLLALVFTAIAKGRKGVYNLFIKQTIKRTSIKWLLLSLFGIPLMASFAILTDLNFDVSMGCLWLYSGKVFGMAVAEIVKNNTISLNN